MAVLPPLAVVLLLAALTVGVVAGRRVPTGALPVPVLAARRRGRALGAAGLAVAAVVLLAGAAADVDDLVVARRVAIVPLAAGVAHAVVALVGEGTWPRPRGRVRAAHLVARPARATTPGGPARAFVAAVLGCAAVGAGGSWLADGSGRSITWSSPDGLVASTAGPFPGWFYSGPILAALAVLVVATVAVLRRVPSRPAVAGAAPTVDVALRFATTRRVLSASTAAVLVTAGAMLATGGMAAGRLGVEVSVGGATTRVDPGAAWSALATTAAVGGAALAVLGVVVLLAPAWARDDLEARA